MVFEDGAFWRELVHEGRAHDGITDLIRRGQRPSSLTFGHVRIQGSLQLVEGSGQNPIMQAPRSGTSASRMVRNK